MDLTQCVANFRNSIMNKVLYDFQKNLTIHEYIKDANGTYLDACINQAKSAGLTKIEELIGLNDRDILNPREAIKIKANDRLVLEANEPLIITEQFTDVNGKKFSVTSFKSVMKKNNKKPLAIMGFSIVHAIKTNQLAEENSLSFIQLECLFYLVQGFTMKEISNQLFLSPRTIEHYLEAIKEKLHCTRRSHLIRKALAIPNIRERL